MDKLRQTRGERLSALLPLLPLAAGLSLWTQAAFPSLALFLPGYAPALFALSLLFAWIYSLKYGKILLPVGAAAAIVLVVIRRSSFLILFNDFFTALQKVTGHISLPTDDAGGHLLAVRAVMLLGGALFLSITAYSGSALWLLPVIMPILEGAFSGVVPLGWGAALMGVGILLLQKKGLQPRALLTRFAVIAVCALLASGIGLGLRQLPQDGARRAIAGAYHKIRYSHRADAMPEGRLSSLKPFEADNTPALKVTTEKPASLYLRGNIYEVYTGTDWKRISAEKRADYAELFCWLHDKQFYGQSQIGYASALCSKDKPYHMTIETLSACGAHGYYPYGVQALPDPDETLIGDAILPRGEEFLCHRDNTATLYKLPGLLNDKKYAEYGTIENAYADYVQNMDLQISQDVYDTLYPLLGKPDNTRTLSQIETLVRDTLDDALEYDVTVGAQKGRDDDFLAQTLRTGRGYSVHYATAAVLMLRYLGIPARYVEGYYLAEKEAQKENILTKANAHAWAELYLNDVGFVPFEVTPGYWDQQTPEPDGEKKASSDSASPQSSSSPAPTPSEPVSPQAQDIEAQPMSLRMLLLLLLPLAAALYVLTGRLRLRRALRRIEKSDDRTAVRTLYAYAEKLRTICPGRPRGAKKALALYLEARYSDHEMTEAHRAALALYVRRICLRCQDKLPWYKRLYYRWLRFYY